MASLSNSICPFSLRSLLQSAFRAAFCASHTQVHLRCRQNTQLVLSSSRSSDNKKATIQECKLYVRVIVRIWLKPWTTKIRSDRFAQAGAPMLRLERVKKTSAGHLHYL